MDNDFKEFEPVPEDLLEIIVDSNFKEGQRMERESDTYTSVDRNFFSPGYSGYVDSLVPVNGKSAWEAIQEIAKRKRVVKVYDLGCGSGNALISLQERGDEEGITIDGLGIAATRERNFGSIENLHQVDANEYNLINFQKNGVYFNHFIEGDVHNLDKLLEKPHLTKPHKSDVTVSMAAFKYFPDTMGALKQTCLALAEGGYAFIGQFDNGTDGGGPLMIYDTQGKPISPQDYFAHLNSRDTGYKFAVDRVRLNNYPDSLHNYPHETLAVSVHKQTTKPPQFDLVRCLNKHSGIEYVFTESNINTLKTYSTSV